MDAYRLDRHRAGFALSRGILRILLGYYLDESPGRIRLDQDSNRREVYGKPRLAPGDADRSLTLSVSHSADLILYAIGGGDDIGVDVEYVAPGFPWSLVSETFLSDGELSELRSLPRHQQAAAFFGLWTRKEAFVKAIGSGLAVPPSEIEVPAAPTPDGTLSLPVIVRSGLTWCFVDVSPSPQYAAALVGASTATSATVMGWIQPDMATGEEPDQWRQPGRRA